MENMLKKEVERLAAQNQDLANCLEEVINFNLKQVELNHHLVGEVITLIDSMRVVDSRLDIHWKSITHMN